MRTATPQRETHAATQFERFSLASAPPAGGFAADGDTPQTPHGGAVNYAPRAAFLASLVYDAMRDPRRRPDANAQRNPPPLRKTQRARQHANASRKKLN